ncbi:hypothetical protein [Microbispora sp. NPDC049125]|uniref:hypothetical protein n=1 Tax=Microbispora sp. NPDC049125 TaxID=3154929 RepID=UPI0034658394
MHEGFSTYETWPYECLHCLRVWEEEYVVRRVPDGHGGDVTVWTLRGLPAQPPWSGRTCPACGCGSVTTFPTGYLAHHPEITVTRPEPATPPRIPGKRARPPFPTQPLLAACLLVLTGVEVCSRLYAH